MPFLGILQDNKLPHVPGTVVLEEEAAHSQAVTGALKHGSGRNAHIVLIPQPSNDPNDPLNWPLRKKLLAFGVTCWGAVLYAAVVSAMLNPAFYVMSLEFDVSIMALVQTSGYQTLVVGVTGPLFSALARKYGKRSIFILASVICLIGNIIGSCVNSYAGILTSRILQGFAIAPYESLIFALISDLFFLHERGMYTALINFILAGISNLTAVVSGPIATNLGWRWTYYLLVLLGGIQTILQFLFAPETSFVRDQHYEIDANIDDDFQMLTKLEHEHHADVEKPAATAVHMENTTTITRQSEPATKKTFTQELALFNGTFSKESLFQLFIAPFAVMTNVAVAWITIVNSVFVTLYVVIAFVLAQLFAAPPYLLSPTSIGLLSLGPFVGGILGAVILGIGFDPLIKWCARRNQGVYEPEYRLIPSLFGLLSGGAMMGWGAMVSDGASPYSTATMHGVILFGTMFLCISTSAYAIDAFRRMTAEIFIASMATKNLLIFGFSYFVNTWTANDGVKHCFFVWGGLGIALTATAPIMYMFGKKYRSYWARHDLLKKWHIETHEE